MGCTTLGSPLRPLFYFLSAILFTHTVRNPIYSHGRPCLVLLALNGFVNLETMNDLRMYSLLRHICVFERK